MITMNTLDRRTIIDPTSRPPARRVAAALCSLLLAASMTPVHAQPEPGPELAARVGGREPEALRNTDAPTLKATYLECDRHSSERLLGHGEALRCSQVAEALLVHVFKGDFNQLLAWWNAEKAQRLVIQAARLGADPASRQ